MALSDDDKHKKTLHLLSELEALGFEVHPGGKPPEGDPKTTLAERVKAFGPDARAADWWIKAGWSKAF